MRSMKRSDIAILSWPSFPFVIKDRGRVRLFSARIEDSARRGDRSDRGLGGESLAATWRCKQRHCRLKARLSSTIDLPLFCPYVVTD